MNESHRPWEAHRAEADALAALLVLDAQVERYEDLPRSVPGPHQEMGYPDVVDPDGTFVRNEDGLNFFAFSDHKGKTVWAGPFAFNHKQNNILIIYI